MKRIIAVIFVILCLCGCDMKRIRTESSIKEYETDFSTVYAESVKFSGMKNGEFEKNINAQIQQSIDSDLVAFDSKAQECKDNLQMGNKCVMEIGWEETYNKNDFISVVEEKIYLYRRCKRYNGAYSRKHRCVGRKGSETCGFVC